MRWFIVYIPSYCTKPMNVVREGNIEKLIEEIHKHSGIVIFFYPLPR